MGKNQSIVSGRNQATVVVIVPELEPEHDFFGCLAPKMKKGVSAAGFGHVDLEILCDNLIKEFEEGNKIGLTSPVCPDKNVKGC